MRPRRTPLSPRLFHHQGPVFLRQEGGVPVLERSGEHGLRHGVLHLGLDDPPEGPGAVHRVVAPLGQALQGLLRHREAQAHALHPAPELGKEVLPPVFDGLKYLEFTADDASCYQSRMVDAKGNSKYGIVDENGRILVPSIYDKVSAPEHGKYGIEVVQGSKIGWYGTDGQEIFPAAYDTLQMEHFWDGNKHRAYFHGSFIDENGTAWHALYDTQGNRLTELTNSRPSEDSIRDLAPRLEEYRIY